jgi:hypothetical protein
MSKTMERQLHRALAEGRVCSNCGWMINLKNWAKGYRLCAGCWDALKGVNVDRGHGQYRDEPVEMTGEMI